MKKRPLRVTTSVSAAAVLDRILRAIASSNPRESAAGYLILAGLFIALLGGVDLESLVDVYNLDRGIP